MARYREFRKIESYKVRELCIREMYFTCGDTYAYNNLLINMCHGDVEVTMDMLEKIAEEILAYSDVESICDRYGCSGEELFEHLLWELLHDCCRTLIERI